MSTSIGSAVRDLGISLVCGVPDSLMKAVIADLEATFSPRDFIIAANEGAAIGLAVGHYLATQSPALVFMQNSGLGNAINPLASLADPLVYSIPMVLLVGWRGEVLPSGEQRLDEPQHRRQGAITLNQLDLLGIPYFIVDSQVEPKTIIEQALQAARSGQRPVAVVMRADHLGNAASGMSSRITSLPTREEMIGAVADFSADASRTHPLPVVATTGTASRELLESRSAYGQDYCQQDFLTVGGMGHAISIATALAKNLAPLQVVCLDGDGAMLMHAGALLQSAQQTNLIHIVLDNGVHDSVGAQPTDSHLLNWTQFAKGYGYVHFSEVSTPEELSSALKRMATTTGSSLIRALCRPGHRTNLARPAASPVRNKEQFSRFLATVRA